MTDLESLLHHFFSQVLYHKREAFGSGEFEGKTSLSPFSSALGPWVKDSEGKARLCLEARGPLLFGYNNPLTLGVGLEASLAQNPLEIQNQSFWEGLGEFLQLKDQTLMPGLFLPQNKVIPYQTPKDLERKEGDILVIDPLRTKDLPEVLKLIPQKRNYLVWVIEEETFLRTSHKLLTRELSFEADVVSFGSTLLNPCLLVKKGLQVSRVAALGSLYSSLFGMKFLNFLKISPFWGNEGMLRELGDRFESFIKARISSHKILRHCDLVFEVQGPNLEKLVQDISVWGRVPFNAMERSLYLHLPLCLLKEDLDKIESALK